jgi:hypothetical protein
MTKLRTGQVSMIVLLIFFALLFSILYKYYHAGSSANTNTKRYADHWVATDALGRTLPGFAETGPRREGKHVGVFYWLWHSYVRLPQGQPPVVQDLINENPNSPAFECHDYYWAEPENGFYHPSDPWSTRRNLQMLANADVDFIFMDYTNGPLGKESLEPFMEVALDMYSKGIPVPKIVFFLNEDYDANIHHLMDEFYNSPEYEPLWFYWHGKPLIMADYQKCTEQSELCQEHAVRDFFTWRSTWAFKDGWWTFIDNYPQRVYLHEGRAEQIAVNKGMGAPLYDGNEKGSSFHNGQMPKYTEYWLPVDSTLSYQGLYFEEHWSRAHEVDPDIICITGWNELTAAAWPTEVHGFMGKDWDDPSWRCVNPSTCLHKDELGNHKWPHGWFMVDQFNVEFNRDIEPMKGGYTDNYYYQMVSHIRRYKGMDPPPQPSSPKTLKINGSFGQWESVEPIYRDPEGDVAHRNFKNVNNSGHYINTTGRNDIIESRVTYDSDYVYFYARTASDLTPPTDPNWMLLFIDSDRSKSTGWEGYDILINHEINGEKTTTIKRWENGNWVLAGETQYRRSGAELELKVPLQLIGHTPNTLQFYFKWADNINDLSNIENFFLYGDVAPDRRFNYLFNASGQ